MPKDVDMKDKKSFTFISKTLIAGGIAGCVAKTIIGPFDRVKILYQVQHPVYFHHSFKFTGVFTVVSSIWRETGLFGIYKGHSIMLARIFPYAAIQYTSYEQFKNVNFV